MEPLDMFELRREIFHILVGILIVLGILFVPYAQFIGLVVLVFGGLISFLSTRFYIPFVSRFLCLFERECNNGFPGKGVIFFFTGSLISLQLFSKEIALASIVILTFSDPISHFIGANFGRTVLFNRRKYIEGTISGIVIGGFFASFFVSSWIAFAGAFVAMFLEAVEVAMAGRTVDDNLLIPIVAGAVMHLLCLRLGFA